MGKLAIWVCCSWTVMGCGKDTGEKGEVAEQADAALFSEGETSQVRTFSIGYDGEYGSYQNELHWARQMAEQVDADEQPVEDEVGDLLPRSPHPEDPARLAWMVGVEHVPPGRRAQWKCGGSPPIRFPP